MLFRSLVDELAFQTISPINHYPGNYGYWGVETEGDQYRDYYVDTTEAETTTFMVYMIGSDLESGNGAATNDMQEMLDANNGESLNVVLQTGGTQYWQNDIVDADSLQRWLIQEGDLYLCDEQPQTSMCNPDTLSDFIKWSIENFPADRYMLVLWDHGGGTMGGFGYDENFPQDILTISELARGVEQAGVKLDLISFDACLMGTLEVAVAFEQTADYLLASEESEPGDGWYYKIGRAHV